MSNASSGVHCQRLKLGVKVKQAGYRSMAARSARTVAMRIFLIQAARVNSSLFHYVSLEEMPERASRVVSGSRLAR